MKIQLSKTAKLIFSLFFATLTTQIYAGEMGGEKSYFSGWSISGSGGYGVYDGMYSSDGQTAFGRIAIGKQLFGLLGSRVGIEAGVQNGNRMRLGEPQSALDDLNGLPIDSTVKPMLDLMATIKTDVMNKMPIYGQLKGGIAYRRWQFDGVVVSNKSQIAGEVQAGFGYKISESLSLDILYQGVFGGATNLQVNSDLFIASVSNIPIEQAALLGLTLTI